MGFVFSSIGRLFRFLIIFVLFFIGATYFQPSFANAQVTPPVKIMVVGDSISQGKAGDYTWRYRIWKHLTDNMVSFDMVGPKDTVSDGTTTYADPNFDRDHDATWGRALTSVPFPDGSVSIGEADTINAEVEAYTPDILLVNIGTNDLAWLNMTGEQVAEQLTNFIVNARLAKLDVKIVLSKITPRSGVDANYIARWTDYNDRISSLAASLSTATSPIVVADPVSGFDPAVDTYDGTHPSVSGEIKIAQAFANALSSGLGIGVAYGMLPAPTGITVKPANGGVFMTWNAVGNNWYNLYMRNVTLNESFHVLQVPAITNSFGGGFMINGHVYEFRLTTLNLANLGQEGPFSNIVTVIPVANVTGLTAAGGVGNAQLSWQAAVGATGYHVYRKDVTANELAFTKIASTVAGLSYTAGTLTNGHNYQFQVSPVNATGEGDLSSSVSATPNAFAAAPGGLTATAGAANSKKITLKWNAVANTGSYTVTGYQIWIKDTNVSGSVFSKWSGKKTATTVDVTGLVKNHTYQFKVTTVNLNNVEGPYSATVSKKAP